MNADTDQLFCIFPTPILICKYENSYKEELEYIRNKVEFHEDQLSSNIISSQSKDTYILNKPQFKEVRKFIQTKLNKFSKEIFKYEDELVITQSWINLSNPGNTHNRHCHPNSIISGVWYVEMPDNSSPIRFHNSIVREINLNTSETNEFNGISYDLLPEKSSLILFPSNLHHDVVKNESNSDRISLSFNTWVNGNFGNKKYLTSTAVN